MADTNHQIGIFGPSKCGKTTLARQISKQYWLKRKMPSLALVLEPCAYGRHAWETQSVEDFHDAVWQKKKGCLVIIEDTSGTIAKAREFIKYFTAIRHRDHDLLVIGHSGTDLLPVMRQNFTELFMFTQTREALEFWTRDAHTIKGLELAEHCQRFEFMHGKIYTTARKEILK